MFQEKDWKKTAYGDDIPEVSVPPNAPAARGHGFTISAVVDSDHAGDSINRKLRTGFLVYCNCTLIYWLSKKQTGVETISFGAEFTAMKQCTEYTQELRYELVMMGISVSGPAHIYGDRKYVLVNASVRHSMLRKGLIQWLIIW